MGQLQQVWRVWVCLFIRVGGTSLQLLSVGVCVHVYVRGEACVRMCLWVGEEEKEREGVRGREGRRERE